ncbi:MAG: hypothetical protein IT379_34925, partial [Deltaproteobacteria bacterium]|nr:hypothetical protein [Deltaproteobacteria bacterium]
GPPPIDAGPPPIDAGPPPLDLGPPPRDLGMVVCASDADCDDFEQCTTDSCVGGACRNARLDDTPCDDGNACTATDLCRAGTCVGEGVVFCMPPTVCFVSTCDPDVGCVDVPKPFGVECNDFDACTPSSMCDGGGDCTGAVSCMDDGNPCTTETCSGLGCVSADVPDGTVCAAGACCGGRCVSTSTDEMNCGSCGLGCASSTSCLSGICTGCGSAAACNDGLTCTVDQCDGTCANILMPGFCLIDGICRADGAMSPTNPCEECDSMRSSSAWSPSGDGAPCDDGLFCTGEIDQCMGGSCEPSGNPCDAMVAGPCEVFVCNEATNRCVRTGGCTLPDVCCNGDYCGLPLFCS